MTTNNLRLLFVLLLSGCATTGVTPGMTFVAGLNSYQAELRSLEARPERWPDRQRLAESIKTTHVATLGGSGEFNRLVDLDLRRTEFLIALRDPRLRPDRAKEIRDELVKINADAEGLARIVKGQFANTQYRSAENAQGIEAVATIGLLNLALDRLASAAGDRSGSAPASEVGPYRVIDEGYNTMVRTPEGKVFRCATILVQEEGAGIRCELVGG